MKIESIYDKLKMLIETELQQIPQEAVLLNGKWDSVAFQGYSQERCDSGYFPLFQHSKSPEGVFYCL